MCKVWPFILSAIFFCGIKADASPRLLFTTINDTPSILRPRLPDPVMKSDSSTMIIPFSRAGNLIIVKARVDTVEGNFILDSGSPGLVLNQTYFRRYEILADENEEYAGINGAVQQVAKTLVKKFSFGAFHYFGSIAHVTNLGHIENNKGIRILGLIGLQQLKNCELIIDYENNLIYLHHITKKDKGIYQNQWLKDAGAYHVLNMEIIESKIVTRVEIGGKKLRLAIDCGAEANLLDSRLPDAVFDNLVINRRVMITGVGNKKTEALSGDLSGLKIGGQELTSMPFLVTNLEKTCFSYSNCIDGILGFDFLGRHKIGFNFVTNKLYVWK